MRLSPELGCCPGTTPREGRPLRASEFWNLRGKSTGSCPLLAFGLLAKGPDVVKFGSELKRIYVACYGGAISAFQEDDPHPFPKAGGTEQAAQPGGGQGYASGLRARATRGWASSCSEDHLRRGSRASCCLSLNLGLDVAPQFAPLGILNLGCGQNTITIAADVRCE